MRSRFAASSLLLLLPVLAAAERGGTQTRPDHDHSHQATATHPFDDVERWVGVFDDPARAEWQKPEEIPAVLGLREGMVVADIGAGTGYFERFFSEAVGPGGTVYAVDTEKNMVEHLAGRARGEKTPNVQPVLAAPDDPRLPSGSTDVVFLCDTYHHISGRIDYIHRLGRVLKKGGVVAVVDFHKKPLPVGPPLEHKLAREAVIEEFEEAGWSLARESDLLPHQYFLIFAPPESP